MPLYKNSHLFRTTSTVQPHLDTRMYRQIRTSIHIVQRCVGACIWVPCPVKIVGHQIQFIQIIFHHINLNIVNQIRPTRQSCSQSIAPTFRLPQCIQRLPNLFKEQTVIHSIFWSAHVIGVPRILPAVKRLLCERRAINEFRAKSIRCGVAHIPPNELTLYQSHQNRTPRST